MAWRLSIDFGTSNTAAAIDAQGAVRPISLSESGTSMPSAIVLTPSGFRVGEEAVNAQLRHPDGFERSPKMLVGRGEVVLAGEIVSPNDIVREIYSYVRAAALRRQDGSSPAEVWLTHPVAWAPSQIEALREGAVAAGFAAETIRTVNEPIAAAAHYARNHRAAPGSRVAVFDFGGGTLDLAVLERAPQLPEGYRVLAYGGDPVLGGRTFDARLLDWALETLARRGHSELADRLHRPKTMSELRAQTTLSRAVTSAKIELSTRPDADIAVSLGEEDAVVTITRKEYEKLIADDLDRAGKLLTDVFAQVSGPPPEVLYLTGGSSRTPAISHMIRERTGIRIATLDDPKLVVAEGALHVAPLGAVRAAQPLKPSTPAPTQAPVSAQPSQNPPASAPFSPPAGATGPVAGMTRPGQPAHPGQQRPAVAQPGLFQGAQGSASATGSPSQVQRPPQGQGPARPPAQSPGQSRPPAQSRPVAPGQRPAPNQSPAQTQPFGIMGAARPATQAGGGSYGKGPAGGQAVSQSAGALGGKKKSPLKLVLGILAAIVVVVGVIWGATSIFGGGGSSIATGDPTDTPTVEEIVVAEGEIECWDGASAGAKENCNRLTGQAALDWLVSFDGASCQEVAGDSMQKECSWYDRPNSFVYVMEFNSYDDAVGYAESLYNEDPGTWEVNGEPAGPHWEGEFTDGSGGYSHVYLYEGQPFGLFVRLDNDPSHGNHDNLNDFSNRFTMRPLSEVAYAVATTERV
ncbi:Hsp70 family protein [Gulosibacter molinativorax]|nr:Hsp70 family protein [Gulosibacter molinativorax]QUY62184.1 Putative heat shock protein 70 [Gulosibacter molinativorax]